MKLCTFAVPTPLGPRNRVGVAVAGGVVDATSAVIARFEKTYSPEGAARIGYARAPADMIALIGTGGDTLDLVRESVDAISTSGRSLTALGETTFYPIDDVQLRSPVLNPPGISCFITWPAHIEDSREKGFAMLNFPPKDGDLRAYYKGHTGSIGHPGQTIPLPSYASSMDVECEMAAIIGVGGKDLSREQAKDVIVGYTIFNDVSYRAIQAREMTFGLGPTKGKDADCSNIMGPWLVTADEVGDPQKLRMSFEINGQEKSSYNTSGMVWGFDDLASYLSRGQTLRPGHVITSGNYPGGSALDLGITLKAGDKVALRIEKLGELLNTIG
jgi:2-keto-4-pentenoate hydratase/2-oxohepta-3-ene-1,7-dioic acid hydratase in catechol pathway